MTLRLRGGCGVTGVSARRAASSCGAAVGRKVEMTSTPASAARRGTWRRGEVAAC